MKALSDEMMEAITGGKGPGTTDNPVKQKEMVCPNCTANNNGVEVKRMFDLYQGGTAYCTKCDYRMQV